MNIKINYIVCMVLLITGTGYLGSLLAQSGLVQSNAAQGPVQKSVDMPQQNAAQKLIDLNNTLTQHKAEWFDFKRDFFNKKNDLLAKHNKEWADKQNACIKTIEAADLSTKESKNAEFEKDFKETLALHKKQCAEWEALMKAKAATAKALGEAQKKQIEDKFEPKPKKVDKEGKPLIEKEEDDEDDEDTEDLEDLE